MKYDERQVPIFIFLAAISKCKVPPIEALFSHWMQKVLSKLCGVCGRTGIRKLESLGRSMPYFLYWGLSSLTVIYTAKTEISVGQVKLGERWISLQQNYNKGKQNIYVIAKIGMWISGASQTEARYIRDLEAVSDLQRYSTIWKIHYIS